MPSSTASLPYPPSKNVPKANFNHWLSMTDSIMNEKNRSSKGKAPARSDDDSNAYPSFQSTRRPNYITVGNGTASENVARLAALLDDDAEHSRSVANRYDWSLRHGQDPFTPNSQSQMYYNQAKTELGCVITKTVRSLTKLQEMNAIWPMHYPCVQNTPVLHALPSTRRPHPARAITIAGDHFSDAGKSSTVETDEMTGHCLEVPRLIQDLSVLKLDLKMGPLSQPELLHSLGRSSISVLLDEQIHKTLNHLSSLKERIEDTASKVLVTGDLNAGKSTFCNALLQRKILPVDQQPCTSIFCTIMNAKENAGVEEVHAVPNGQTYRRNDESTYHVFKLNDLKKIVVDNDTWSQCMVYMTHGHLPNKSLLINGMTDIILVDAPGLNMDSVITTANYAKQEEIDVVVFVISAANHFTQSAREFVFNAAREKDHMFMVVNGFDSINDQEYCQQMILKQIRQLSPATFKEASELVHFVSSNAIPTMPADPGIASGAGSNSTSGSINPRDDDDDDDDDDKSNGRAGDGKNEEPIKDFQALVASLRTFILDKRAHSKLAPAKTYLFNLLGDLNTLAAFNQHVAQSELDRISKELKELEPELEKHNHASRETSDNLDRDTESIIAEIHQYTTRKLVQTIDEIDHYDFNIVYPGVFGAYSYAEEIKHALIRNISEAVASCEKHARDQSAMQVSIIQSLGVLHLGHNFPSFQFRSENMFQRRRDALVRQIELQVEFLDFFDLKHAWDRQAKLASTGLVVGTVGMIGQGFMGGIGWVEGVLGTVKIVGSNNLRRFIMPGMFVTALFIGISALASIQTSLPRCLGAKFAAQLAALDYTQANAMRISSEVRRALNYPTDNLRIGMKRSVEKLLVQKASQTRLQQESAVAQKFFRNLVHENDRMMDSLRAVDLDIPNM